MNQQPRSATGRPREFDPGEAVAAARDTFWTRGYQSVSISDLEKATGVVRTSLYNAFGSKRGMFDAALTNYLDNLYGAIDGVLKDGTSGLEDVHAFFDQLKVEFARGVPGCLMVNSMVEFGVADASVTQRGADYLERLRGAFMAALARAASLDELRGEVSVNEAADLFVLVTLGLNLAARFDTNSRQMESFIKGAHTAVNSIAH
jgi:TetR/AcrR family transcriptional repressor of nem operon